MSKSEPFCYVVWCDDVRQEVGNKPSFMGVYTGGLVVPRLPLTLPRLNAWIVLSVPIEIALVDVSVILSRDDGLALAEIPAFTPEVPDAPQLRNGVALTRRQLMFALTLAPLELPEECKFLQVVVKLGNVEIDSPKLHVQIVPAAAQATPVA